MTAKRLAAIHAKLDQFWELIDLYPESDKYEARLKRFFELLKEYERTADGLHHAGREGADL